MQNKNTLNKIDNTASTTSKSSADIFDTLSAIPKDMKNIISNTSTDIKNVFKTAWTKGKRYQRVGNTLLSPFVALGVAVEGAVRSVITPAKNFVVNTFFKYEDLKTENTIKKNKNWLSKRRFSRKVFQDNNKVNNTQQINNRTDAGKDKNKEERKDYSQNTTSGTVRIQEKKPDSTEGPKKAESKGGDKENSRKSTESVQENSEHKGVDEAKRILSDSACGKIIIDRLCANHKEFGIIFDNTTSDGRCNHDNTITIGTQMPNGIAELAPFNWETRDPKFQKKHLLLHELSHGVIYSHAQEIPGIQEGLNIIEQYIEARKNIDGRTLSILSYNNNTYETTGKKAKEDFVEMLALRMNGNGSLCKKYLKLLSDEENKDFRESHGLVTITKEHASKLQGIFDSIIHYYENLSN